MEAKKREKGFFRLLADSCPDLIIVLDGEGVVRYASPSLYDTLGYKPHELVGKKGLFFLGGVEAERINRFLLRIAGTKGHSDRIDLWARHKDGSYRNLEALCAWFPYGDTAEGVMLNARDMTETRKAQEILGMITMVFLNLGIDPLKNMRQLLWAGKETLGTGVSLYCRLHRGKLRVISTSQEDEELELSGDLRGLIGYDVIAGEAESPLIIGDLRGTEYGQSDIFVRKHGIRACTAHAVAVGERTVGCMYACYPEARDFSEMELAVMELGAKAMAGEEERAAHEESIRDLTDIVSHELRHPITILRGYATFLEENWNAVEEEKKREILGTIGASVDRLDNLINELLDVSRIEKGLFSVHQQEVDLKSLFDQALEEMRGMGFENEFSAYIYDGYKNLRADPERLKQLIIILLDNAVKYSPRDSTVELRATEEDGRLVFSILDEGPGILDKDRERIFDRFFQSEQARNHSRTGIGLGLYIAREIARAHGGEIWYEPRAGGGSCFRFTLSQDSPPP